MIGIQAEDLFCFCFGKSEAADPSDITAWVSERIIRTEGKTICAKFSDQVSSLPVFFPEIIMDPPFSKVCAGEDSVCPELKTREIINKIGCEGYIYGGYGHGVYDEVPDYLSRAKEYLNSLTR